MNRSHEVTSWSRAQRNTIVHLLLRALIVSWDSDRNNKPPQIGKRVLMSCLLLEFDICSCLVARSRRRPPCPFLPSALVASPVAILLVAYPPHDAFFGRYSCLVSTSLASNTSSPASVRNRHSRFVLPRRASMSRGCRHVEALDCSSPHTQNDPSAD